MKIENLEKINVLQEKCHLLYPIDSFYDNYWKNATIEEFSNYICGVPFKMLHKKEQSDVIKKFDTFKSISDE